MKKRIFSALLISALAVSALTACGGSSSAKKSGQTLTVLNYGKYIDESVVKQFEKETGIKEITIDGKTIIEAIRTLLVQIIFHLIVTMTIQITRMNG